MKTIPTFGLLENLVDFDYKDIATALFVVATDEQLVRVAERLGANPILGEDNEIIGWE